MNRILSIVILLVSVTSALSAQCKIFTNKPYAGLKEEPGFVTINEFTYGIGLGDNQIPYSKRFFGFTTVNGYQIDKNFIIAAGTGIYFYNGGEMIPLFLDFRYSFQVNRITPYAFADGGLLFNISDLDQTKLFINPGIGARYTLTNNWAINLGAGLLTQAVSYKDSFINFKLGAFYKF